MSSLYWGWMWWGRRRNSQCDFTVLNTFLILIIIDLGGFCWLAFTQLRNLQKDFPDCIVRISSDMLSVIINKETCFRYSWYWISHTRECILRTMCVKFRNHKENLDGFVCLVLVFNCCWWRLKNEHWQIRDSGFVLCYDWYNTCHHQQMFVYSDTEYVKDTLLRGQRFYAANTKSGSILNTECIPIVHSTYR